MKAIAEEILENKLECYENGSNYNEYVFDKSTGSSVAERDIIRSTKDNHAWRLLKSNHRVIGPVIVFAKKIVRRCLKWYIEPIADQQSEYNNATYKTIISILNALDENKNTETQLQQESIETNNRICEVERDISQRVNVEVTELQSQNKEIQEKYIELQKQITFIQETCSGHQDIDEFYRGLILNEIKSGWDDKKMSYSQSGEDMIVTYILNAIGVRPESIKYLDLGANHAKILSNTYFLYTIGARGVLVEANPALIPELKLYRSDDVILNRCVSKDENGLLKFYVMSGDGLSTSDYGKVQEIIEENSGISIKDTVDVPSITGKELVEKYFDGSPDLLSIDIEGVEMEVLESIDLSFNRPKIIIIETVPYRKHIVINERETDIVKYLEEKDYIEYAFTGINSIFIDNGYIGGNNENSI